MELPSFLALGLAPLALAAPRAAVQEAALVRAQKLELGVELSGHHLGDLDGDGRDELLVLATDGRVLTWGAEEGAADLGEARGELRLPRPAHSVLAVGASAAERPLLFVADPDGLAAHAFGPEGAALPDGRTLARRARFSLRTGSPRFVPFLQDVNRDGRPDAVIPGPESCELWLNQGPREDLDAEGPRWPALRKAATISVNVERWGSTASGDLSNVLEGSFAIPGLSTRDVNGDGRPDLLVVDGARRSFHLQADDGAFPAEPTVRVDLARFRDTTPGSAVAPGQTLSVEAGATFEMRDLDGDGVTDYVLAHRRKVWVFHGSEEGPQFERPSTILKAAEDVTALTVLRLDDDDLPDLLLVKVQVPTVATLVRGLFGEWDVRIDAVGYRNAGGRSFETKPAWRGEVVVRLPAILRVLKNPGDFLEKFEELEKRFRVSLTADLDGDGTQDVMLSGPEGQRLDVWLGRGARDGNVFGLDPDRALRQLLFEDEDRVWDLDRMFLWLGGLAERRVAYLTGGRGPDLTHALDVRSSENFEAMEVADVDGDGRAEVLVFWRVLAEGRRRSEVDVLRMR